MVFADKAKGQKMNYRKLNKVPTNSIDDYEVRAAALMAEMYELQRRLLENDEK